MSLRIFLPTLLIMSNLTIAQWFWQNPLPQGNSLTGINFISPNSAFAVGIAGTILKTSDGGQNWIRQISGTTKILYDLAFIDTSIGTAVGEEGTILRTTDGGQQNWIVQISGTTFGLRGISFIDANTGTVVGGEGTVLRTTNGGTDWISQSSGTTN